MRQKFSAISDVLIIGVALFIGYSLVKDRYFTKRWDIDSVKAGDVLPTVEGVNWSEHDLTLLLFLKRGCHFCEDSLPFYQRLITMERGGRLAARIVVAFPDDASAVRTLAQSEGLNVATVAGVSPDRLRVRSTPTVILVARNGEVLKSWVGMLSPKQELEVVAAAESQR